MMLSRSFAEVFVFEVVAVVGGCVGLVGTARLLPQQYFVAAHRGHVCLVFLLVHLHSHSCTVCLLYSRAD